MGHAPGKRQHIEKKKSAGKQDRLAVTDQVVMGTSATPEIIKSTASFRERRSAIPRGKKGEKAESKSSQHRMEENGPAAPYPKNTPTTPKIGRRGAVGDKGERSVGRKLVELAETVARANHSFAEHDARHWKKVTEGGQPGESTERDRRQAGVRPDRNATAYGK